MYSSEAMSIQNIAAFKAKRLAQERATIKSNNNSDGLAVIGSDFQPTLDYDIDPLSLLRHYNINKKEIIERDNQIIFGEFSWPKNIKTNYLMFGSGKEGADKKYYTLESLVFILKYIRLTHPIYVRQAVAANIPAVLCPDRDELLAYLNGETATCASIDKSAPLEIPTQVKHIHDHEGGESAVKKPHIEEIHVQKVQKQVAARLDTSKAASVTVDNMKYSSEAMSIQNIAAFKAKRLAQERATIKSNNNSDGLAVIGSDFQPTLDYDIDPLSLLRHYNIHKKEIIERDNQIIFGEFSWPKNIKTNYLMFGSGKEGADKKYYTLESLVFILKYIRLTHPIYVRQAVAANIPAVLCPDRDELLAYLNGETATCASIDKSAPLEIPTQVKHIHDHEGGESAVKKPHIEEIHVQKVQKQVAARLDTSKAASVTVDNMK